MDNVVLNVGTGGDTVAADEIGGAKFQRIKLIHGADGTNAGDVSTTNGLPVQIVSGTVAVTGTFWQATQPISGTVTIQDGGGSITVDGTVAVTGTFWQATQPISVASIPSHDVTNAGTFAVQAAQSGTWNVTNISGAISLPTGAATAANQSTGNTSLASIDGKTPALGQALAAGSVPVVLTATQLSTLTPLSSVSVSNFPATQTISGTVTANAGTGTFAVSAASLPLPSGASTAAKQPAIGTAGTASTDVITIQGIASMTAVKVDGSAVTQPISGTVTANAGTGTFAVSAASLPLPSGAATSAKQPALGTAGTPSTDVLTVQGAASMTAIKVDGSAVTQPVSGTFWQATQPISGTITANIGTSGSLALDATLTGGTAKAINRGGAKGTTTAADITSTASGANHQAVDVAIWDASGNQLGLSGAPLRIDPTGTTTQPVSLASVPSHAVTNVGTFAVQDSQVVADNAGFTDGTTKVFCAGFIYDEVAGTALTENDAAAGRINVNRAQIHIIEDGSTRGRYATVTASNALKVDASGVAVPITDNSGSLTVDAPVGTPVFVRLSDGAAAISTLPVSLASVPSHDVTNAGTFAVQAAHETGSISNAGTALTPKFAKIAASSSGDNTIVAAVTSKKIRVLAAVLMSNGTVNAKFQSGASGTDLTGLFYTVANTGACLPFNPVGWFETAATTLLNLNLSAAVAVGGCITYVEV